MEEKQAIFQKKVIKSRLLFPLVESIGDYFSHNEKSS